MITIQSDHSPAKAPRTPISPRNRFIPVEQKIDYTGGPQGLTWTDSIEDITIQAMRDKITNKEMNEAKNLLTNLKLKRRFGPKQSTMAAKEIA